MKNAHVELITKAGGHVYEVGGTVRDFYIAEHDGVALEPKDRDYVVTGIPIEDLIELLKTIGGVDLVGKSFGVIKFRPEGKNDVYDIALPRTEIVNGALSRVSVTGRGRDHVVRGPHRARLFGPTVGRGPAQPAGARSG